MQHSQWRIVKKNQNNAALTVQIIVAAKQKINRLKVQISSSVLAASVNSQCLKEASPVNARLIDSSIYILQPHFYGTQESPSGLQNSLSNNVFEIIQSCFSFLFLFSLSLFFFFSFFFLFFLLFLSLSLSIF